MNEVNPEPLFKSEGIMPPGNVSLNPQPVSGLHRFLKAASRWLLSILVVFALGAAAAVWLLYLPLRSQLAASEAQVTAASDQIAARDGQLAEMTALETARREDLDKLKALSLENKLRQAEAETLRCLLALKEGDVVKAKASLARLSALLVETHAMLESSRQPLVKAMQDRLALVNGQLSADPDGAAQDLDRLLVELAKLLSP